MENKEIQERNKQIALMLDWDNNKSQTEFYPPHQFGGIKDLDDLVFHLDWDWLMGAVEFIENIRDEQGYGNMINIWVNGCNVCENNAGYKIIENIFAPTKKEAVFLAVSDFAKLYNEKKL